MVLPQLMHAILSSYTWAGVSTVLKLFLLSESQMLDKILLTMPSNCPLQYFSRIQSSGGEELPIASVQTLLMSKTCLMVTFKLHMRC